MQKALNEFADNLAYQAHSLWEQSDEFPQYKAVNEIASKELSALEEQFRRGEVDSEIARKAYELVGEERNPSGHAISVYDVTLRHIGFDIHYATPDQFLTDLMMKSRGRKVNKF